MLTNLTNLRLEDNRLSGPIPSQLNRLTNLRKVYLTRNAGFSGCVPPRLREVRFNDIATLNLPDCASDAPETPETPLPAYTLTVTAGEGRRQSTRQDASTHTRGRPGRRHRELERRHAHVRGLERRLQREPTRPAPWRLYSRCDSVSAAHSANCWRTRCDLRRPTPTCILAVYLGAPDDYAQVQDIPAELLLTPDVNGRYVVERGQQVTVVTAAPLPSNHDRFIPDIRPDSTPGPTSYLQLVPPVGTTYSLTASGDAYAADRLEFHLRAALTRPGSSKPIPGAVVVTTAFEVLPDPLALALASSSELCTANTLAELSWTISGGKAPYTLTIDGETVNARAESHDVNCGPLEIEPLTSEPLIDQFKIFQALVTDEHGVSASAGATVEVLGPGAPTLSAQTAASGSVALRWSAESTSGVTHWEYRQRQGKGDWGGWTRVPGSGAATTDHTISGLTEDARYSFHLRAVSGSVAGPRSGTVSATAGLTPTVFNEREILKYDDLDSSAGATRHGSYALLTDATNLGSGATTFAQVGNAEALLLNTTGYVDRDYSEVLADVQVGDRITWYIDPSCWYHYRVTGILANPPAPERKLFRLSLITEDQCGFTTDQQASKDYFNDIRDWVAVFYWDDPPSEPEIGPDGIRIFPEGYPVAGGHTYRLRVGRPTSIVFDVPIGMRLTYLGFTMVSGPSVTLLYATYIEEVSGGSLGLDPISGEIPNFHVPRPVTGTDSRADVIRRFRVLITSIREAPLP